MGNKITGLLCPPGSKPKLIDIENDTCSLEKMLEGPVGIKELGDDGICLLFNDDGDIKDLVINRVIQGEPIYGSCFFCRKEGAAFISLTPEEIKELEHLLS